VATATTPATSINARSAATRICTLSPRVISPRVLAVISLALLLPLFPRPKYFVFAVKVFFFIYYSNHHSFRGPKKDAEDNGARGSGRAPNPRRAMKWLLLWVQNKRGRSRNEIQERVDRTVNMDLDDYGDLDTSRHSDITDPEVVKIVLGGGEGGGGQFNDYNELKICARAMASRHGSSPYLHATEAMRLAESCKNLAFRHRPELVASGGQRSRRAGGSGLPSAVALAIGGLGTAHGLH